MGEHNMNTELMSKPEQSETIKFHEKMYKRRQQTQEYKGGLSEKELADQANDPALLEHSCPPVPQQKSDINGD
jgi:hypothetical protein